MEVYGIDTMSMRIRILVDVCIDFTCSVDLIYKEIQLDQLVELFVLLDFGKSNVQIVVPIKKDKNVAWYLAFAKDATIRHSLLAYVSVNYFRRVFFYC